MKPEQDKYKMIADIATWLFVIILILTGITLIVSCQKEETYCFECKNDVQTTEFCGYTFKEMNQVIEDWEGRQGNWKCQIKERSEK